MPVMGQSVSDSETVATAGGAQGANLNQAEAVRKGNGQNLNQEAAARMCADKSEPARPPTLYLVKRLLAHHKRACRALVRHNRRGGYRFQ